MKIETWVQTPMGRWDAEVRLEAGEDLSPVDVLDALDRHARENGIWLLGRAALQRNGDQIRGQLCALPCLELPALEGRRVAYHLQQPTEEQLTQQMHALAQTRMISSEDDEPARPGDLVHLDFDAALEDETRFSCSMGRGGSYHLAPGEDLPEGVWQAVVGKKAGDAFTCTVRLPYTFWDKRAAGKTAVYTGTVKRVVHQILPPLDDALAQSFGQADLAALRQQMRSHFLAQETKAAQQVATQRVLHALCDETTVELPPLAVELEAEYQWRQLEGRLEKSRISLESHLRRLRKTRQELDASIRTHAEQDLKLRAVFLAVARQEGLTVTQPELDAALAAATQGRTGVQIDRMQLRQRLYVEKGMRYVTERLTLTPAEPTTV